jgi:hypothetical protein
MVTLDKLKGKWPTLRIFENIVLRIARAFGTCHSPANPQRHQSYGKSQTHPQQTIEVLDQPGTETILKYIICD